MKKNILGIIACLFLLSGAVMAQSEKEVKIKTSAVCKMCKERIERNLGLSKGIKESDLNLKDMVVTVRYNPKKTNEEAIRNTIVNTGYDADELPANEKSHDKLPDCCQRTVKPH
ncbi:copper chaperone CopZ [Dyadobacter jejuensis]|uniref:Copper chaperone CopZ n=1 Tax=Dyadobacter jejuensis TaxID=1082580 RepID=A0A316APF5_9BACT|nr:heavy metal-associated domain-containing protein [Dyadobacter jejuensis]PWJ59462.1 copper chaperone CopZ [Dyadobacter jejuensis]